MLTFNFDKKSRDFVVLLDCANGTVHQTLKLPAIVGSEALPLGDLSGVLKVSREGGGYFLEVLRQDGVLIHLNGSKIFSGTFALPEISTLQVGSGLYYLGVGNRGVLEKFSNIDFSKWLIFYSDTGRVEDEIPFARIKSAIEHRGLDGSGIAICPKGFELGFQYRQVFGTFSSNATEGEDLKNERENLSASDISESFVPSISDSASAITCPLCWLKFDVGDAFSIASHESLRGDPILGEEEMLRFLPVSFNSDGVALDPAGIPAPDLACPHCRKKLPYGYIDLDRKIFSIVGAPSSGKSYYLSVLIKELQDALYRNFEIAMKDMDPTGNILLTQMKNRLYSATKPEEAILAKTTLEGAMYERYPRFGKMVSLPKPFSYLLTEEGFRDSSIIFYDNAGEHFEPGLDIEESPGAMHVASSDAIFFIFDPASNRNFKRELVNYPDPQLSMNSHIDQQDTLISEMEIRIKRILSLDTSRSVKTPLAVIIGKCDIWKHLLSEKMEYPIVDGKLDISIVDKNSEILREFLIKISPSIVANSMLLSSNVKFFAVSALGHSPQILQDGPSAGKIAPIPEKFAPIDVEIPTIWALSQISKIIPIKDRS